MTASEFLKILKNPSDLEQTSLQKLQENLEEYPYCMGLRMLAVKKNKKENSPSFSKNLALASIHAPHRGKLYHFLSENILTTVPEDKKKKEQKENVEKKTKVAIKMVVPPPVFSQSKSTKVIVNKTPKPPPKQHLEKEEKKAPVEDWLRTFEPARIPDKETKTTPKKKFKLPRIPIFQKELLDFLDNKKEMATPKKGKKIKSKAKRTNKKNVPIKKEQSLTDKKIIGAKNDLKEEKNLYTDFMTQTQGLLNSLSIKVKEGAGSLGEGDWNDESTKANEAILSETLADLLAKQGQNKKAIKMYQALSLKFPEKNRLFANKIAKLKA